jgi:hypothetical protein
MGGWVDGWMDGWMDGWIDREVGSLTEKRTSANYSA